MITDFVAGLPQPWALLLSFPTWVVITGTYLLIILLTRNTPHIYRRYNNDLMNVGDLARGGSAKSSKLEARIRAGIARRNHGVLPDRLLMKTHLTSKTGAPRKFTPDIVVWNSKQDRCVVEVDPFYTHGQAGMHKVYEDLERNLAYTKAGYAVVRVRIGFPDTWHATRLGAFDVVLPGRQRAGDITDADLAGIATAVRRAKVAGPGQVKAWRKQLMTLQPYMDAYQDHQQSRASYQQYEQ